MLRVKLSYPDTNWPILRQTPGGNGIWGNCQFFVNDECDEYDFWVVYEGIKTKETAKCRKENTILITAEPPGVKTYHKKFLKQFGTIMTFRTDIKHQNIIKSQPALPWMVGGKYIKETNTWENEFSKDYDELSTNKDDITKNKLLSIILSKKTFSEGHLRRDLFIGELKKTLGDDLDVFGIGFEPIKDKWDGIAPYRYYLAFENSSNKDYWTEKLSDCFLAGAYPIYYGCTNINDYFSNDCLTSIDITNIKESILTIKNIVYSDTYERSIKSISDARNLVLNKYNLFPMITGIIKDLAQEKIKNNHKRGITLKPEDNNKIVMHEIKKEIKINLKLILPSLLLDILKRRDVKKRFKEWQKIGCPIPPPHIIKQFVISEYQKRHHISILIETGTYMGDMVEAQKRRFKKVFSVELGIDLFETAKEKFKNDKNVTILQGDSGVILPEIIKGINKPAIFWLDGHYSAGITAKGEKECPILMELEAILNDRRFKHVILVDDARLFDGERDYPTIEELISYIKAKNKKYQIEVKYDIIRVTV